MTTAPEPERRPERPEPGSLWVTPDGDAYRLRDYRIDWHAEPYTGEATVPTYVVLLASGGSTNRDTLPDDARLVWQP